MRNYQQVAEQLRAAPKTWLVTGVAGFIGSNLLQTLLGLNQKVLGIDNFATGHRHNLESVRSSVDPIFWSNFRFSNIDITDLDKLRTAVDSADIILHQAALGSVPRSIIDPLTTHQANVNGFVNMLLVAKERGIRRFVYASSSSVYGDEPTLPKVESRLGRLLSPYATSKLVDELYADQFYQHYGIESIGLRYFNVFGPRQDPKGAYAAVVPRWIATLLDGQVATIYGDGSTSRDFCFIDNVIQANILAATCEDSRAFGSAFNIAAGASTTLLELYQLIATHIISSGRGSTYEIGAPVHEPFRAGDIQHSLADISKAREILGYSPTHSVETGLGETIDWYRR